jgi:hypothetical protein
MPSGRRSGGGLTPPVGVVARAGTVLLLVFSFVGPSAQAYAQVDRGIAAKKLIILDRNPTGGASKTSFRVKDDGLAIGAGEDVGLVDARFEIAEKDFKHPSPRVPAPRFVTDNLHCVNQPPT